MVLDAFASWMMVYMFCIEKVSKMGLFWVSLFLVICHCSDWRIIWWELYAFGYGFWGVMFVKEGAGEEREC